MSHTAVGRKRRTPGPLAFIASAFGVTAIGIALDIVLMQKGVPGLSVLYLSNVLIGTAAGALVLSRRSQENTRHQMLKERIEMVREANQHLRTIVTGLALYGSHTGGAHAEVLKEHLRSVETNLSRMFGRLLCDQSLPPMVIQAAKDAADSTAF